MIVLSETGTLDIKLDTPPSGTVDVETRVGRSRRMEEGELTLVSAGTTEVIAVSKERAREVMFLSVTNRHPTIISTVTVIARVRDKDYELHKTTLVPGTMLRYKNDVGFQTLLT